MANFYFEGSFGGVPIKFASVETSGGRDIAIQSPSRGDKHVLQDRGKVLRKITAELLFVDEPGADPYLDRYAQFQTVVQAGDPAIFYHPIYGGFLARAEAMSERLDGGSQTVKVNCTFLPEDEPQTTFPVGAGTSPSAGVEAVTAAADEVDTQLAAVGLTTTVTADSVDAATSWDQDLDLDSQAVFLAVASLTQQISDAVDELDLASDINKWQSYRAIINLAAQVARAGDAATSAADQVFSFTVPTTMPLRSICAQIYGSTDANDQADATAKRNRLSTPGLVPAGTVLIMTRDGAR